MKKVILIFSIIASCFAASAQVKVGDNPTTVNPNSVLEVESTNKGLLLPRVALTGTANVAPLAAHVAGMTVYNTATAGDVTPGYYYNEGTKWVRIADGASGWLVNGNAGLNGGINFIGTTDTASLVVRTNNQSRMRIDSAGYFRVNSTGLADTIVNGFVQTANRRNFISLVRGAGTHPTGGYSANSFSLNDSVATSGTMGNLRAMDIGVTKNGSTINTNTRGLNITANYLSTGSGTGNSLDGIFSSATFIGQAGINSIIGLTGQARLGGGNAGAITTVTGVASSFGVTNGPGTPMTPVITDMNLFAGNATLTALAGSSITVTNMSGLNILHGGGNSAPFYNVTNFHGAWLRGFTGSSNGQKPIVANMYGLRVEDVDRGTVRNFAIYTNKGKVRFGDSLVIGTNAADTVATNLVHIKGIANPLRVEGLSAGAATDSIVTVDATGVLKQRSISSVAAAAEPWFNAATGTAASGNTQNIYQLGNVGIGTTNPTSILEVSNQADTTQAAKIIAKPKNVSGGAGISIFNYNGLTTELNTFSPLSTGNFGDVPFKNLSVLYSSGDNLAISNNGSGNIYFTTGFGTARQTILNNGNVGIGTKTPSSKLALYESTSGKGAFKVAFGDGGSAGDNSWIGFNHGETSTDANDRARIGSVVSAGGAGNLFFTTGGAGVQAERVRIDGNGNVGIGTSSPDVKLQVNGDAAGSGDVANQSIFRLVRPGVSGQRFNPLVDFSLGGTASGTTRAKSRFSISLSDDETNSPDQTIMTLLSGGNVGIGTTAPSEKLTVGVGNAPVAIALTNDSTTARIGISTTNAHYGLPQGGDLIIQNITANKGLALGTGGVTNANVRLYISGSGNVGIGTRTPTTKLQVIGIPAFATDAAAGAAGLTAGGFWQTSGHATLPNGVLMVKQ